MMLRSIGRLAALGTALLLAGCASVTSGSGNLPSSPATSGFFAPLSSLAPSSPATSAPLTSTAAPTRPSPSGAGGCLPGSDYCDDFSDATSGWPVMNSAHYYANYDAHGGGTYRMGERTVNAKPQVAPFDITTISKNYGVQVDVDAVLGNKAPSTSYIGLVCWDQVLGATESAFLFFVTADSVDVTLLPDDGGQPRTIDRNQGGNFVQPYPAANHLTATCVQKHSGGGTVADLTLVVNGASVLHEQYAKSVKNYPWISGPHVGLLVGGKRSDVFYDNFAVTGR